MRLAGTAYRPEKSESQALLQLVRFENMSPSELRSAAKHLAKTMVELLLHCSLFHVGLHGVARVLVVIVRVLKNKGPAR